MQQNKQIATSIRNAKSRKGITNEPQKWKKRVPEKELGVGKIIDIGYDINTFMKFLLMK